MHIHGISRRRLLQSLAASAAALPFTNLVRSSIAHAQSGPPKRLLLLFTPHGCCYEYWRPQGTQQNWTLQYENSTLAPLEPWKNKLCVLDGIDLTVLYDGSLIVGDRVGHGGGISSLFTGTIPGTLGGVDFVGSGPSVDQVIADHLISQGVVTPHRSLELVVGTPSGVTVYDSLIHGYEDGDGRRIQGAYDPQVAFTRLFGNGNVENPEQLQRVIQRRQSVLDFGLADLNRLRSQVGTLEREKLDAHADALRAIEQTLQSQAGAECGATIPQGTNLDPLAPSNHPAVSALMTDILSQAFACDLTRVSSLQYHFAAGFDPMPWLGINADPHESLAHHVYIAPGEITSNQQVFNDYITMQTWYAQQVADLLAKLDAIPDAGGGTVLDNTILVWGNELGDSVAHTNMNVPFIVAGGGGGSIPMGRWMQFSQDPFHLCNPPFGNCPDNDPHRDQNPHNHLLVAVCQAFGMNVNTFGSDMYEGPLEGLLA